MLKDTFTPMADHLRNEYGVTDMLTVDQIKAGIDGLCANNLLSDNVNGKQSDANKGVWFSPTEASGSKHVSQSWLIFDYPIVRVENERSFYNQLSKEVKFKITNTRFTVNPMGGVNSLLLFAFSMRGYAVCH